MLNKVTLIGNLGADPDIRRTQGGDPIANMRVACTERWNDKQTGAKKERTEWVPVVVFGPLAKVVEQYCKKGTRVYVEGKFQTRKWQDSSSADRYTTECVVQGFGGQLILLTPRDSQAHDGGGEQRSQPKGYEPQQQAAKPAAAKRPAIDDEIPF